MTNLFPSNTIDIFRTIIFFVPDVITSFNLHVPFLFIYTAPSHANIDTLPTNNSFFNVVKCISQLNHNYPLPIHHLWLNSQ